MTCHGMRRYGFSGLLGMALLAFGGCTYDPGHLDNPLARSFSWFSYLNADDLRQQCGPDFADHFRLIYHAHADEQIRTYDLTRTASGGGALTIQVRGAADLRRIALDDPLAPWRGTIVRTEVDQAAVAALTQALEAARFSETPEKSVRMHSWGFFWLVSACVDGRFAIDAWTFPSSDFQDLRLAEVLELMDPTGIPFNPPRKETQPPVDIDEPDPSTSLVLRDGRIVGHVVFF